MKKVSSLTLLASLIFLVGCEDLSKVKIDDLIEAKPTIPGSSGGGVDESVIFSGISTATNKSDSAVTLNWVIHARAVAYDIFSVTNGDLNYLTTIVGGNVNSVRLTGLTPSQTYHFRARVKTSTVTPSLNVGKLTAVLQLLSRYNLTVSPDFTPLTLI